MVMICYISNTSTALLEDMWGLSHKNRGIKQTLGSSIFSNFNRVAFLEILQALLGCSFICPFNTQVPNPGCFPHLFFASILHVHIIRFNGMSISLVVKNAFHQVILSAFNVKLGINILCNYMCGIIITAAIRKLNFISHGVQH
jgi:hypothetical protein